MSSASGHEDPDRSSWPEFLFAPAYYFASAIFFTALFGGVIKAPLYMQHEVAR